LGQYGYAAQVGQKPIPYGGGMFKVDMFVDLDQPVNPRYIVSSVRYWDKAGTQGAGKFTAGVKMAKLSPDNPYGVMYVIEHTARGQWATHIRNQRIRRTAKEDGKRVRIYVEQEPGSGGKESAEITVRELAGWSVRPDRPTGDKIYRADPYSVQVNRGNFGIVNGPWTQAFKDEHEVFSPESEYKDQVDAAAGCFAKLVSGKKAGAWGSGSKARSRKS